MQWKDNAEQATDWDVVTPLFKQSHEIITPETFRMERELIVPKAFELVQTIGPYWMMTRAENVTDWGGIWRDGKRVTLHGNVIAFLPPFSLVRWLFQPGRHRISYVVSYKPLSPSLTQVGPFSFVNPRTILPTEPIEIENFLAANRDKAESLQPWTKIPLAVLQAKQFIEAHYKESFSVKELAKRLGNSHSGLTRAFRRIYGLSPANYRVRLRCFSALYQIQTSDLPIAICATEVGYHNIGLFNRQFRGVMKAHPSTFRKSSAEKVELPRASEKPKEFNG